MKLDLDWNHQLIKQVKIQMSEKSLKGWKLVKIMKKSLKLFLFKVKDGRRPVLHNSNLYRLNTSHSLQISRKLLNSMKVEVITYSFKTK